MYKKSLCVVCALCCVVTLFAQTQQNPLVSSEQQDQFVGTDIAVLLAQAEHALDLRKYEEAAERYRAALRLAVPLPEAEYGLGLILHADGLRETAEQKYLLALSQQQYLRVPEVAYEIRYQLATLYREQGQLFNYEQQLVAIVADDQTYNRRSLRDNARRVLYARGLDRLFELYRFDTQFAFTAHAELGEHYVRSGNYTQAVDHLMFAFVLYAQRLLALSAQHILNPSEDSYSELFIAAHRIAPIHNQLEEGYNIYRLLFYLGAALYGDNPQRMRWRDVFSLLIQIDDDSPWISLARERLITPQLERLYQ